MGVTRPPFIFLLGWGLPTGGSEWPPELPPPPHTHTVYIWDEKALADPGPGTGAALDGLM